MIPKPRRPHTEDTDSWLMSYADMITLLMCFFIIFVSVSEPKKDRITEIAGGMSGKFGAVEHQTNFADAARSLQATVEKGKLYKDVAVEVRLKSLSMEIATGRFFVGGGIELDPASLPMLAELVASLKQSVQAGYRVTVESHTDDTPPQSGLFKNNWELSSIRAGRVADYLVKQGIPADMVSAVGFGDSRPKVPNLDAKGSPIPQNRLLNQRVTIRVEEG